MYFARQVPTSKQSFMPPPSTQNMEAAIIIEILVLIYHIT
jgi:hypothetical protein